MPVPFGIDADTSAPLPGIDPNALAAFREGGYAEAVGPEDLKAKAESGEGHFGAIGDVDSGDLSQTGWAVIFAPGADPRIRQALQPLLDRRKAQVGDERLFKVFEGPAGYQPGDTAGGWLARHKVRMDVVDPLLGVPYYVLIVGPPDEIPFEFQYGLDLYWAVGRLWLQSPDDFRQYADSVLRYEDLEQPPTSRQMAVFATRHEMDAATQLFADQVAKPAVNGSGDGRPFGERQKFKLQPFIGDAASRENLHRIFGGAMDNGAPALLFSGSHGKAFKLDDPRQETSQGAILCSDWAGVGNKVEREHYFDASDLPASAKVHGMVHVLFACYGGGWPQLDNFDRMNGAPKTIAARPAMARLPQALLSHREGAALAVLAHVERAWAWSFRSGGLPQIQGFRDVLGRIMLGKRLGDATDQFNMRWAALSTELAEDLDQMRLGKKIDDRKLASQWVARDDARNYVLLGDPAVQLRAKEMV
jgi:hypothetical protein